MYRSLGLAILMIAVWLGGCTVVHRDIDVAIKRPIENYREQETHISTVLRDLGPPTSVGAFDGGVAFLYEHLDVRENQLGINFDWLELGEGFQFLEWLKFSYGKAYADREAFLLVFDAAGVLQTGRFVSWRDDLGTGTAVQLLLEVAEVVDTTSVREAWDPNDWGGALLRTPPEVLNSRQNLDLGQVGVELRGTPAEVGQHTLEMRGSDESTDILNPFDIGN